MKNLIIILLLSPLGLMAQVSAEAYSLVTNKTTDTLIAYTCGCTPVSSFTWSKVSGPGTQTVTTHDSVAVVSGLQTGAYIYRINTSTGTDTVGFTVALPVVPPTNCDTTIRVSHTMTVLTPRTIYDTSYSTMVSDSVIHRTCVVIPPVVVKPVSILTTQTLPTVTETDNTALTLGIKFSASVPGYITGVKFYKTKGNTGTHTAYLYSASKAVLASATFANETATGWQTATFSSPVAITAGTSYTAAYYSPAGFYTSTLNAFSKPLLSGNLTVPATGGVYNYGKAATFPTQSYQNSNYWTDILFSPK